ncbi:hypothetical protein ACVIW2_000130 [Bradyrhizobium huanghuaihaiense]|nr:hypothetical protein [Bradyrhizobium elkanii]MCP1737785.1 hypothetical protein [Bradyrhizobium elkanii]MCS3575944.1 hypothetical protein [Bradyrhizobium elkanii]MCS3594718.1 hypothetical protein [Bradyrhizobium elkanii]MCS3625912.1 hypothetical protein [Bradyrhizobium elkanii]
MITEVGLRCAAGVTAIWWRFAMSFADRDRASGPGLPAKLMVVRGLIRAQGSRLAERPA